MVCRHVPNQKKLHRIGQINLLHLKAYRHGYASLKALNHDLIHCKHTTGQFFSKTVPRWVTLLGSITD